MIEQRGSLGTVTGNRVIQAGVSVVGLGCAHGNHVRIITRSVDGGIPLGSIRVVASGVACGHHHYDARLPRRFHRLAYRVKSIRFENATSQREIDDANVVGVFKLNCALNGRDHLAVSPGTVGVKHAEIDDVGIRSDAHVLRRIAAGRVMAVPGYDSGHMRAVSVSIIRARIAWNEALAIDDARSTSARLLQVVMIKDAAVDHRYADSRAIQSVLLA